MKDNPSDLEWIERYILQTLNAEEIEWMKKRMATEPQLRNTYEEYRMQINAIRYAHLKRKLIHLRAIEEELRLTERKIRSLLLDIPFDIANAIGKKTQRLLIGDVAQQQQEISVWKPWAIAATVTVLSFSVYFVMMKQPVQSIECLASISTLNKCF
jgi:hypothetical protein